MSEQNRRHETSRSWDAVANWYAGWVGTDGSDHHRRLAIPTVLGLLDPKAGERILDIGCGPGVLTPHIDSAGARYTGVDKSRKLLAFANRHHGHHGRFLHGDATRLHQIPELRNTAFDAVVFMLSIQDIAPLEDAFSESINLLRHGGRIVLLMTHPCFRVPRQSGWGWDHSRKLRFRRIDRYLTPLSVPMKAYGRWRLGATRSHHRPLEHYVNALTSTGALIDKFDEVSTCAMSVRTAGRSRNATGAQAKAERNADREIPLFLGIRAVKR